MIDLALDNNVFIMDPLDEAIQELDILFNTVNTELIGNPSFGTDFLQFLWELTPSPNELRKYLDNKISYTDYARQYIKSLDVDYKYGDTEFIYVVSIVMQDPRTKEEILRTYNIK